MVTDHGYRPILPVHAGLIVKKRAFEPPTFLPNDGKLLNKFLSSLGTSLSAWEPDPILKTLSLPPAHTLLLLNWMPSSPV